MINGMWNLLELKLAADKQLRQRLSIAPENFKLLEWSRCMSHQVFLLQTNGLLLHSSNILSRLYGMTAFLERARYWNRICLAWSLYVDRLPIQVDLRCMLVPTFSPAVSEMLMYVNAWSMYYTTSEERETETSFAAGLKAYFMLSPTTLCGPPKHPCPPGCCPGGVTETKQKFKDAGIVFFQKKLASPATNKWTKQWQSTDFCFITTTIHGMNGELGFLRDLWKLAFSELHIDGYDPQAEQLKDVTKDAKQLAGERCHGTTRWLDNVSAMYDLRIFGITVEAVRVLTINFLPCDDFGKTILDVARHSNLVNPKYSILVSFHQYISTLVFDDSGSGRLQLLGWQDSYSTFAEWICANGEGNDNSVRKMRRSLMLVDGWCHRRLDERILSLNFLIAVFADERDSPELRKVQEDCASSYDSRGLCCLTSGLIWQLKMQGVTVLRLSFEWQAFLRSLCTLLDWTIADAECSNAKIVQYLKQHPTSGFGNLAAHMINSEWMLQSEALLKHYQARFICSEARCVYRVPNCSLFPAIPLCVPWPC